MPTKLDDYQFDPSILIDAQIAGLKQLRVTVDRKIAELEASKGISRGPVTPETETVAESKQKRPMSAEHRKAIGAASAKRWAGRRKEAATAPSATASGADLANDELPEQPAEVTPISSLL